MLDSEQLAYIARIVDGEGSISLVKAIHKNRPVRKRNIRSLSNPNPGTSKQTFMRVNVSMTDRQIPEWLHSEFGGSLSYRKYPDKNWADRCDWNIASNQALEFLKAILPYLRIKHVQAVIAISFQEDRKPHIQLGDIGKQADEILYNTIRQLNQRGKTTIVV